MLLNQTTIGELYQSLSSEEIKELELYIRRQTQGKSSILYQLHRLMKDAKAQGKLGELDYGYIKAELFDHSPSGTTKLTTYTHLLINHIKEFLLLSKIKEKNIYTETLWGEILIERRLSRNLLIKLKNFKYDLYKDQYPLMKLFFHQRESFFYQTLTLTKKNYEKMLNSLLLKIKSFENYLLLQKFDMFNSFISLSSQRKHEYPYEIQTIAEFSNNISSSENDLININSLMLRLVLGKEELESFFHLKDLFFKNFNLLNNDMIIQIFPVLLNFCGTKQNNGIEDFAKENYLVLRFVYEKGALFNSGIFSIVRFFTFIRLELRYGSIENAKSILQNNLSRIPTNQKQSFENLTRSTICFASEDYKTALRHISSINPSDSIYYFPQYKIMLIKCHVMLEDIDRVQAERDNFYKYIYNNKNIPEDAQRRHKLFIKYAEYLIDARYEFLTDYMRRRLEKALLPSSPYFTEKSWMRERWNHLKEKYQK